MLTFSTQNGFIYALDDQSGKQRWSHHTDGDINLTALNQSTLYVEVGTIHILQGAMGVPPQFIPRYLLALNNNGIEQHSYPLPQGFYPYELAAGNDIIFLIGSSYENFDEFHDLRAFSTTTGGQLWQNKIRNLPRSGFLSTVVP